MKKYILMLLILLATPTLAANTTGYAWSESVGWFDFSNVTVTNTAVTGYAYNDNTGWLVLDGVTNTNGTLSGYAWSESVGYFDFSNVSISGGTITGYAYNDNIGWLSFSSDTTVTTTWTPVVAPTHTAGGGAWSAGSSLIKVPESLTGPMTLGMGSSTTTNQQIIKKLANNPRDLKLKSKGDDVKLLQQFLNSRGFTISTTGVGSIGYETTYFGNLTKQALSRFQAQNNIIPAEGYFGKITRAFINSMIIN